MEQYKYTEWVTKSTRGPYVHHLMLNIQSWELKVNYRISIDISQIEYKDRNKQITIPKQVENVCLLEVHRSAD